MTRYNGLFVVFDGPNGVGKTTLLNEVAIQLRQQGYNVLATKEPTRSSLGQFVRDAEEKCRGKTLAYLVAADRQFHLEQEILPALAEGMIVFSDRYIPSSLVPQQLDGVHLDFIWSLNDQFRVPDLTVILTAPLETLIHRLSSRHELSRFEKERLSVREVELYLEAIEFLRIKGFNVFSTENNDKTPIDRVTALIIEEILKHIPH